MTVEAVVRKNVYGMISIPAIFSIQIIYE